MKQLYEIVNYTSQIAYLFGNIVEYDLEKANISSLLYNEVIDEEMYNSLKNVDKFTREKTIGLMIRDNAEIYTKIQNGIITAKKLFFEINAIQKDYVIAINNDAIILYINKPIIQQVHPLFNFKIDGQYTTYLSFPNNTQFFYNNTTNIVTVKGISQEKLELHSDYFISFIIEILYLIENTTITEAIKYYNEFEEGYRNRFLPIEYYREFNSGSAYNITVPNRVYYLDSIAEKDKEYLSIYYNYYIIRLIGNMLYQLYFQTNKIHW